MVHLARLLLWLAAAMPRMVSQFLGNVVGLLNYWFDTRSAKVCRANIKLCLPAATNPEQLRKRSLIETGKTMVETPAVWVAPDSRVDGWIETVENEALLLDALKDDRGLLILLPHTGNWELFNVYFSRHGQFTALYQPPRQPYMQEIMAKIRERRGNDLVPTTRSGIAQLYRVLAAGGSVVVLPDQIPASGRYANFFGQPALTDELSSRLIKRSGARALGACVVRNPGGKFSVRFIDPDEAIYSEDLDESVTAVNKVVETAAEQDLSQYQWEYKRFRERPSGSEKIYRFDKPPGQH